MTERLILSALVENHPGVLLRVAGLFSRRGYNITSLNVCETEDPDFSRMTIVAQAEPSAFRQIEKQLLKVEDVKKVVRLNGDSITASELLLIKIAVTADVRRDALSVTRQFGARVIDIGEETITVELTGMSEKLDDFISRVERFGVCELARTGINALESGDSTIKKDLDI